MKECAHCEERGVQTIGCTGFRPVFSHAFNYGAAFVPLCAHSWGVYTFRKDELMAQARDKGDC